MMACLDDETVLGLVEGRLAPDVIGLVDDHLDTCDSCRDVVTHVARAQSSGIERGQVLGRYVIGDLLGSGAMGCVYSAWEPELDRRVAIKIVEDRSRVLQEARAMAQLDHPNVVGVHEVGTSEHGVYVAMDLVEGETLRAWTSESWRSKASVLADVARGLAAIHAAGITHRDVKPDNVIVGADGRARIGDFGLARAPATSDGGASRTSDGRASTTSTAAASSTSTSTSDRPTSRPELSRATSVAGTPAYMAPEVLHGRAATAASDQFSFGVMAYEVIAGHRPFEGSTWRELLTSIESTSVAKLRDVPSWLDAIVRRCLAVDPAKRFASMTDVATALDDGARRAKPVWIVAAAGAALIASGATWFALRGSTANPTCAVGEPIAAARRASLKIDAPAMATIDRWATAWREARASVCRASSTESAAMIAARERCLEKRRVELDALLARVGTYATTPERLADALAALPPSECTTLALGSADPFPLDPQAAAHVRAIEAELPEVQAAIALGDARPVAAKLAALVERARTSGHAPTEAAVLLLHAESARALSSLPEAATAARDAAAAAERGHDDLAAARAWVERTTIAGDRRELVTADDLAAMTDAAIVRAGSPPHLVARLLRLRGLIAYNRGQLDEARELLVKARAAFVTAAGEKSVEVSSVESSLGSVAKAAGDLDAAEKHHGIALAIDRELRGANHPDIARDLHNLAGVARSRERLDDALALYQQALQIEISARGPTSAEAALTHNSIGLVLMARGAWKQARVEVTAARDAFEAAGHGDLAFAEHNLGLIAAALHEYTQALAHFEHAARDYASTIGNDAQAPIRLHLDRAHVRRDAGDPAGARADAIEARALAQRANIVWIAAEAERLLASLGSAKPPVKIATTKLPPAVVPTEAPKLPKQPEVKIPDPPQPKKDVGVYGPSQGW
jgi:tetratricopeptide (TPR) repeat protein